TRELPYDVPPCVWPRIENAERRKIAGNSTPRATTGQAIPKSEGVPDSPVTPCSPLTPPPIRRASSALPGRPFLEPVNIRVVGRRRTERKMVAIPVIGFGAFIEPFFDLRMTVGKIKPAGPVMVTGWEINNLPATGSDRGESVHLGDKIAVVDAVVPLIEQNKRLGGRRCGHVADLFYDCVTRCPRSDGPRSRIIIADPIVHRHRAHVGIARASESAPAPISRAAPDAQSLMVRPQMAFHQINRVGVVRVVWTGPSQVVAIVQCQPATDPG